MPFSRPSLTALTQSVLTDIANASLGQGALLPTSVLRVLANSMAGLAYMHTSYLDWIAQQSTPWSSTNEYLESWGALRGCLRKDASLAGGTLQFTGVNGTVIPAGTALTRADLFGYTTDTEVTIVGGFASVHITALSAASLGNSVTGTLLTLSAPIAGITSTATTLTPLVGGADVETDEAFRTRVLYTYANPISGGSLTDYVIWAEQIPSVTRAWSASTVPGQVTVYAMMDDAESLTNGFMVGTNGVATLETRGTAATGDQLVVADWLYPLRSATALVIAASPNPFAVNLDIGSLYPNTIEIQSAITAAIADMFVLQGTPLGQTLFQSDFINAIDTIPGLLRYTFITPLMPLTIPFGYLPVIGTTAFAG